MITNSNINAPSGTATSLPETPVAGSSNSISPETAAVIVAVIVPVVVIAIVVLCFFQIQKHWKMRQAQATAAIALNASVEAVDRPGDVQLYLQNKAELSVERTGFVVQLPCEISELMNREQCQEIPEGEIRQPMLSLGGLHELRGEDPARELDSSQDQEDPQHNFHGYSFDEPVFVEFNESVLSLHKHAWISACVNTHIHRGSNDTD